MSKFLKYSGVGIISTIIYFLSVYIFVEVFSSEPVLGSAIAFIIMTFFSFILNKTFTFGGNYTKKKLTRFYIVAAIGFTLNYFIMNTIVNVLSYHYVIGELITIVIIPIINFTLNYFWTFKG
ncbi:GtrA family protein [Bacillus pinisoli]|uniref:GtrA family protein n=1 Tax=Bacillus pinisoli TaxID=2901866 RepID=UPI001FF2FC34|nr:GtrA family protein [Bacillus pinisoli]